MELPRQENGVLYISGSSLVLHGCSLDTLIEYLGFPETYYYLTADSRFVIFKFPYELGQIFAIVFFQEAAAPVIFEPDDFYPDMDRGNLAELQIELDESLAFKEIGKVRRRLQHGGFKFVVFSNNVVGRALSRGKLNALSFLNPNMIKKPELSFMARSSFWLDRSSSLYLQFQKQREEQNKLRLQEISKIN